MQKHFNNILDNYVIKKTPTTKDNPMAEDIKSCCESIRTLSNISTSTYIIKGSIGNGNMAEIPWIAILDKGITESATQGFYLVYLFQADMKGIYLSLNQGWTHYTDEYKKQAKTTINIVSKTLQSKLHSALGDFPEKEIHLFSNGNLGKGYELGHICGKYYDAAMLPSDAVLIDDLRNMLGVYRELKGLMKNNKSADFITSILAGNISTPANSDDNDSIDELNFQRKVNYSPKSQTPKAPQPKPPSNTSSSSIKPKWSRNPSLAREAIENAQFQCEFSNGHQTFISQVTGRNFVEAHHLIPMEFQDNFNYSLDVPGNIISLCPNCHRAFHHADIRPKNELIKAIYFKHCDSLREFGIPISLKDLINLYNSPV